MGLREISLFVCTGFKRICPQGHCLTLKSTNMNYRDLLESGANVSVTVNLDDLKEIFKEVAGGLKPTK